LILRLTSIGIDTKQRAVRSHLIRRGLTVTAIRREPFVSVVRPMAEDGTVILTQSQILTLTVVVVEVDQLSRLLAA